MKIKIIIFSALFLTGCINAPIKIKGDIQATIDINPNYKGQAAPLQLKIYYLKNSKRFMSASYRQLVNRPYRTLGKDLTGSRTIIVRPGQRIPFSASINKNTRYLGFIANYRKLRHKKWRWLFTISIFRNETMTVRVMRQGIRVSRPIIE